MKDEEIYISQPTGNYWRNIKLTSVNLVELVKTSWSAYCDSLIVDEENGNQEVFVLS